MVQFFLTYDFIKEWSKMRSLTLHFRPVLPFKVHTTYITLDKEVTIFANSLRKSGREEARKLF